MKEAQREKIGCSLNAIVSIVIIFSASSFGYHNGLIIEGFIFYFCLIIGLQLIIYNLTYSGKK